MLIGYLVLPFIFAIILGVCAFIKNPIYIRRIAKIFYFIQFLFSVVLFFAPEQGFGAYGIDKYSEYLLFVVNLMFFLFSIASKTFISKLHRVFYATSFLILGLVDFIFICNNVFALLICLFWIVLLKYFLSISFSKNEYKKDFELQLMGDLFCYFLAIAFISKEFLRYFVINDIEFSFLQIANNLSNIDDNAVVFAFIGFLVIIFKLFNFIPFGIKNYSNSSKNNPFLNLINSSISLALGCFLLIRIYQNFDYLFYQFQDCLAIYLLINFVVFVIFLFRQKNVFKYLFALLGANVSVGIFSIFCFEIEGLITFFYFALVFIISYILLYLILAILSEKFKTCDVNDFKKINDSTKITQMLSAVSFLNISLAPCLALFNAQMMVMMMNFSVDYDGTILNIASYILLFGLFCISLSGFNMLYKILIVPVENLKTKIAFSSHQIFICTLLLFLLALLSICVQVIFNKFSL